MTGWVAHEGFDGFVGGEAEVFVEFGCGAVAFFGSLPEEAVVVAEVGGVFHLRLVLEDGVALEAELFGAEGHGHFDVVDFPFGPCAAVHPCVAVLHPGFVEELVDGGEHGVEAYAVGAVGVGEVAGHEYLVGFYVR